MRLEAGKYYVNRKGDTMGPTRRSAGVIPWCAPKVTANGSSEGPTVYWYYDGTHMMDGEENEEDLVHEATAFDELELVKPDMVNSPPHYQSAKGIESIDAIEAALTPEEFRGFLRGNCLKYLWRCERKGGIEDLKKAAWYLNRLIETPKP